MADRGQAFTLEAIMAALLLVASLVFALQATAVTPQSASGSSQHVEDQQAAMAAGLIDAAVANGTAKPTVLYWNESRGTFHGATDDGFYVNGGPPTAFGSLLDRAYYEEGIVFNVNVQYVATDGALHREELVNQGGPSDTAVRAVRTLTLYDGDVLYGADETPTNVTLENSSTFYAPDAAPDGPIWNVVRIEVVVWHA